MSSNAENSSHGKGSRLVRRTAAVLRAVVGSGDSGIALVEISKLTTLPKPTVYRVINALADEGMVRRDSQTLHYHLAPAWVTT